MNLPQILLTGLVAIFFIAALIPLLREQIWWLRAFTYARLQKFWAALVLGIIYVALYGISSATDFLVLSAVLVIIGLTLRDILPFMPVAKTDLRKAYHVNADSTIHLLVGNVLMDNDQSDGLIEQIEAQDPDLIFLVETNAVWRDRLSSVEESYPYNWLLPLEDYNGMLLYSKYPLSDICERRLVQDHIPSVRLTVSLPDGRDLTLYGLHPRPPRPEDDAEDLDHELLIVAEEIAGMSGPVIVTGDLNDVGWSTTTKRFRTISGTRDPRRGRGLFNSYNAKTPLVRWPLDHVFVTDHFELIEMERLEPFGSDHFPISIGLHLRPSDATNA